MYKKFAGNAHRLRTLIRPRKEIRSGIAFRALVDTAVRKYEEIIYAIVLVVMDVKCKIHHNAWGMELEDDSTGS